MNDQYHLLRSLVPPEDGSTVDWDRIMESDLNPHLIKMSETPQNPEWHGEGDVFAHTKLACESLICMPSWHEIHGETRIALFIATLLHDIGKIKCTRVEDGKIVSPNHTSVGERMARAILWKDFGIGGRADAQQFRETVCSLIRNHSAPLHLYDDIAPERKITKIASQGELVPGFSNELLSILVEADVRGRVAKDTGEQLERLYYFREIAREANCLTKPFPFPNGYSRYAYLAGRGIAPGQALFDDTWGEVVVVSGLPGTGKDTYIKNTYPGLPVVSLDELRREMGVSPKENQGIIVDAARDMAKGYLRKKQPFVWNATNVTPQMRQKVVTLMNDYRASVKLVFLEASWEETLRRNRNRKGIVPESVIDSLLNKLVPPNVWEAHRVEWELTI